MGSTHDIRYDNFRDDALASGENTTREKGKESFAEDTLS